MKNSVKHLTICPLNILPKKSTDFSRLEQSRFCVTLEAAFAGVCLSVCLFVSLFVCHMITAEFDDAGGLFFLVSAHFWSSLKRAAYHLIKCHVSRSSKQRHRHVYRKSKIFDEGPGLLFSWIDFTDSFTYLCNPQRCWT